MPLVMKSNARKVVRVGGCGWPSSIDGRRISN